VPSLVFFALAPVKSGCGEALNCQYKTLIFVAEPRSSFLSLFFELFRYFECADKF
jgi:hypothetical protein